MDDYTTIRVKRATLKKISHIKNSNDLKDYDVVINRLIDEKYPNINKWIRRFMGR